MKTLGLFDDWPVENVAAAVIGFTSAKERDTPGSRPGFLARTGDISRPFRLASVTKPLVARAAQVAIEEGAVDLDTPAGPPGSTVRHLLAHTSGVAMLDDTVVSKPGTRRVYSNYGFRLLAETIEEAAGIEFGAYLSEAVLIPVGMEQTTLDGGAAAAGYGASASVSDLVMFAGDLLAPSLVSPETHADGISVQFPGLDGVLPGYGAQRPNDWGLGFELKSTKQPHWTGANNSPRTFGHFGQSGTFIWVDPDIGVALVVLTDRDFGDWAKPLWPAVSDEVLREFGAH